MGQHQRGFVVDAGGAEAAVRAAAGLQVEDDATGQPARVQATRRRRSQVHAPEVLAAGVPPQAPAFHHKHRLQQQSAEHSVSDVHELEPASRTPEDRELAPRTPEDWQLASGTLELVFRTSDDLELACRTSGDQELAVKTSEDLELASRTPEDLQLVSRTLDNLELVHRTSEDRELACGTSENR